MVAADGLPLPVNRSVRLSAKRAPEGDMDTSIELVRLKFEGRWTAEELGQSLLSLSDLYDLRLFLEYIREDCRDWERFYDELMHSPLFRHRWKRWLAMRGPLPWTPGFGGVPPILDEGQLSRLSRLFEREERLEVRRINYASPGFSDLAGIGSVIGHLKDFILKLLERHDSRRQRELSEERAALENDRIRIENARNFVALARDLGYSETDVRMLMAYVDRKQEPLVRLVEQQKLRGVSKPDDSSEQ